MKIKTILKKIKRGDVVAVDWIDAGDLVASISIEKKCEFDSDQIYDFDEPKEKE